MDVACWKRSKGPETRKHTLEDASLAVRMCDALFGLLCHLQTPLWDIFKVLHLELIYDTKAYLNIFVHKEYRFFDRTER